jgi:hypothetical protein
LHDAAKEKLVELVTRLRHEHDQFERTPEPRTIEAAGRKNALRTTRAQTFVDIQRALEDIVEIDLLWQLEQLTFEQKLARLEAFLEPSRALGSDPPAARRRRKTSAALCLGMGLVLSAIQWVVIQRNCIPDPPSIVIGTPPPRHLHARSTSPASEPPFSLGGAHNPPALVWKSR